jgi:hypothetical protein
MLLKKCKRIEKNIFISTGKITIVKIIGVWHLEFEICDLFEIWCFRF